MAVSGNWSTQDFVTDERVKDWSKALNILIPNISRFTTLQSKEATGPRLTSAEFNVWEQDDLTTTDALAEALDTSETGVDVVDGTKFRAGDIIQIETQTENLFEQMYVVSISTNTLTVIRGFGGTAGTACDTGTPIMIIGNVSPEDSTAQTPKAGTLVKRTNYAEIFRIGASSSNTALYENTRPEESAGAFHRRNLMFALRRVKFHMEGTAFFGQAKESTAVTPVIRRTGGLHEFISSANKFSVAGPVSFEHINALAGLVYDQGTPELDGAVLFIGPGIRRRLSEIATSAGTIRNDEQRSNKWGFRVEKIETPWGEIPMVQSSQLRGSGGANITRGATGFDLHGDKAFLIKLPLFKLRWARPMKLYTDIQANDRDGKLDEYRGEYGHERRCPLAHAMFYGANG